MTKIRTSDEEWRFKKYQKYGVRFLTRNGDSKNIKNMEFDF